jgi:hypothetical protein
MRRENSARNWMTRYDAVWTMSEDDRTRAIAEGAPADRIVSVANGVDIERFVTLPDSGEMEVFYVGSFRHLPNIIGFEKLRNEVMPIVWRRFSGVRLRVVAGRSADHLRVCRQDATHLGRQVGR